MDADSILKSVAESYLAMRSYCDSGSVEIVEGNPSDRKYRLEFKTYFVRPNKVRFEWHDLLPDQKAIWTNGLNSYQNFLGRSELVDEFWVAIAMATGVSHLSVLKILKLLLPECIETRTVWQKMRDPRSLADAEIDGTLCYHLLGSEWQKDDTEAWISKDDLIVLRLRSSIKNRTESSKRMLSEVREHFERQGVPQVQWPKIPSWPRRYYYEYQYHQIQINKPIADEHFETNLST